MLNMSQADGKAHQTTDNRYKCKTLGNGKKAYVWFRDKLRYFAIEIIPNHGKSENRLGCLLSRFANIYLWSISLHA